MEHLYLKQTCSNILYCDSDSQRVRERQGIKQKRERERETKKQSQHSDLTLAGFEGLNRVLLPGSALGDLRGSRRRAGLALGVTRSGLPSKL